MKITPKHTPHKNTKTPIHNTQKRNKSWKKRLALNQAGETKKGGPLKPGYLQGVVAARVKAAQGVTLSQIKPVFEFPIKPSKANGWDLGVKQMPKDLQHRMLSYMDQFDNPVRPKQVADHFINHPTNSTSKEHAYKMLKQLASMHATYKIRKIDEEGQEHWFVATSTVSRTKHNRRLQNLIDKKLPLPLEEVVWQEIDPSQAFENLREMKTSAHSAH